MNETAYTALANVYDTLMYDVDYDKWACYIDHILLKYGKKGGKVLDVCCGTGEMTILLSKKGYQMTGLDRSSGMLMVASEKARGQGQNIPFVMQDMAQMEVPKQHVILSVMDGVNYLLDEAALLCFFKRAYEALFSGGILLFDISSAYKLSQVLGNNCFTDDTGDVFYHWDNAYDPDTRQVHMELTFFKKEGTLYRRLDEKQVQKAHEQHEITTLLQKCGFEDVMCYGAFTCDPPKQKEERLQFVALKG